MRNIQVRPRTVHRTQLMRRRSLIAVLSIGILGCGDGSIVEGIDLDLRVDAPFSGSETVSATVTPRETPGFSQVDGAVACVKIDTDNSFATVNSVQAGSGNQFTLTATIVGETVEAPFLTWQGTVEVSQNQTLFRDSAITVASGAEDALTAVYQLGLPWSLRMEMQAAAPADALSIRLAPRFVVNTADGGCN